MVRRRLETLSLPGGQEACPRRSSVGSVRCGARWEPEAGEGECPRLPYARRHFLVSQIRSRKACSPGPSPFHTACRCTILLPCLLSPDLLADDHSLTLVAPKEFSLHTTRLLTRSQGLNPPRIVLHGGFLPSQAIPGRAVRNRASGAAKAAIHATTQPPQRREPKTAGAASLVESLWHLPRGNGDGWLGSASPGGPKPICM